jgi:hypothetical protein
MNRKEKLTGRIPRQISPLRDLYEENVVIVHISPFLSSRGFLINHLHSITCLACLSTPFPRSEGSYATRVFGRLGHIHHLSSDEQTVASMSSCTTSSSLSAAEKSLSNGGRVDFLIQKYPGWNDHLVLRIITGGCTSITYVDVAHCCCFSL